MGHPVPRSIRYNRLHMQHAPQRSRPWLTLALTFALLGIGFANPFQLVTHFPKGIWEGSISWEILNLYALTTFGGLAHFTYAWQGQWLGTQRLPTFSRTLYWLSVFALLAALLLLRSLLGVGVFSLSVWIYNIAHFIRAETYFAGSRSQRQASWFPVIAFTWFTLTLFQVGPLANRFLVFSVSLLLIALSLSYGGWRSLTNGTSQMPLLTFFLLGETLVWSGYSPYMTPAFRVGIYVLHIAAASFFHYLSSYFFTPQNRTFVRPGAIIAINLSIIAIGILADRFPPLHVLLYLFGVEWFTLWVALHLAASDLLPWWKRRQRPTLTSLPQPATRN